jgi:hypothetical protein
MSSPGKYDVVADTKRYLGKMLDEYSVPYTVSKEDDRVFVAVYEGGTRADKGAVYANVVISPVVLNRDEKNTRHWRRSVLCNIQYTSVVEDYKQNEKTHAAVVASVMAVVGTQTEGPMPSPEELPYISVKPLANTDNTLLFNVHYNRSMAVESSSTHVRISKEAISCFVTSGLQYLLDIPRARKGPSVTWMGDTNDKLSAMSQEVTLFGLGTDEQAKNRKKEIQNNYTKAKQNKTKNPAGFNKRNPFPEIDGANFPDILPE